MQTRWAKRNVGALWMILLAGAFVAAFGGVADVGQESSAASLARGTPNQEDPGAGTPRNETAVLIAAGDIADCGSRASTAAARATAALVRGIPGTVATLGDHVYEIGAWRKFANCYDPTWGTERPRTRPAAGNHEYKTRDASGYFDYFGTAAGDRDEGYYSYDLGSWHIVVLNSNCDEIGGCESNSPQGRWLRRDLATHPAECTLAYWHHPLFSSGEEHGSDDAMRPAWEALYKAGADVVLSAHEHNYERFAPQDPDGQFDRARGVRQFVVGTGGAHLYGFGQPLATSEVREAETFGVLALILRPSGYDWIFIPVEPNSRLEHRGSFTDSGHGECH